jgi:hypothetical protein
MQMAFAFSNLFVFFASLFSNSNFFTLILEKWMGIVPFISGAKY